MLVEIVGPILEPRLSVHQTAVAGGDCGSNLRAAFAHLRTSGPLHEGALPREPPLVAGHHGACGSLLVADRHAGRGPPQGHLPRHPFCRPVSGVREGGPPLAPA
eukprot:1714220-Alexandrium_andersonii.AAC.1